jgi:hypothetical protein
MFRRHHEECRPEKRVGARREHREVDRRGLALEHGFRALGTADPVALHRDHVLGPVELRDVLEQPVGVVGDLEEPLLELLGDDRRAAALAAAVDHLLVGEHRLVLRAPLDRRLPAIGEAAFEELHEDPLRPAVVRRLVRAELATPVDRDAPGAELAAELLDRVVGRDRRMLAGPDRMVLCGQAERVIAHWVQHPHPVAAPEVGEHVAHRVVLQVAHVGLARGVRQHLEHVALRGVRFVAGIAWVRHLPGALRLPDLLPLALDRARVVPIVAHVVH